MSYKCDTGTLLLSLMLKLYHDHVGITFIYKKKKLNNWFLGEDF